MSRFPKQADAGGMVTEGTGPAVDGGRENAVARAFRRTLLLLDWIKFPHSLFALPFALMSAWIALSGHFNFSKLAWIVVAMVGARSSAMGFNRIVDRSIDAANPRTKSRHLPAGILGMGEARAFVIVSSLVFLFASSRLNALSLALSPVALAVVWGYSYTKRFTSLSHFVLGFALGIAPAAAWIGVRGELSVPAMILCVAVTFWTAGFDILYACQDVSFDRRHGLHSIPARLGLGRALRLSTVLHLASFALLMALPAAVARSTEITLGAPYGVGLLLTGALLAWQHRLVRPDDLSRLDTAFFTLNGFVSIILFLATVIDVASFR